MNRGFTAGALVREGLLNVVSNRLLSLLLALSCFVGAGGCLLVSGYEVSAIEARFLQLVAKGSAVLAVTAQDGESVPGERCEALNGVPGVISAGGIVSRSTMRTEGSAFGQVLMVEGTAGLPAIIWPGEPAMRGSAITAGSTLAERSGAQVGAVLPWGLRIDGQFVAPSAIAEPSPRDASFDLAVVIVRAPASPVQQCLVESAPGALDEVSHLLVGWFDGPIETFVSRFYADSSVGASPQEQFDSRLSRWVPYVAALIIGAGFVITWFARRQEFGLYRMLRASPGSLLTNLATEFIVIGLIPLCGGYLAGLIISSMATPLALQNALIDATQLVLLSLLTPLTGVLVVSRVSAMDAIKGR